MLTEQVALYDAGACSETPLPMTEHHAVAENDAVTENDAICDDAGTSAQEIAAWARHASAASGFGDPSSRFGEAAENPDNVVPDSRPRSYESYRAARAHRAFTVGDWMAATIRACGAVARRAWDAYRQRRQARAIFEMLHRMDDRALRDLGFHRAELGPLAAGEAEHSRMRVILWTLGL